MAIKKAGILIVVESRLREDSRKGRLPWATNESLLNGCLTGVERVLNGWFNSHLDNNWERKVNKPSTPQILANLSKQVISTELTPWLPLPIDLFPTLQWIPRANSPIIEILKIVPSSESANDLKSE